MARTQPTGKQIADGSIQRDDLDVATAGQAVVRKLIQGAGIGLSSTGVDAGTGDVTIATSLLVNKTIYVDPVNGSNTTGTRGRLDLPFLTITGAIGAGGITSGDVIFLLPGTFTENSGIELPSGVSLIGSGRGISVIQSTLNLNTSSKVIVKPGSDSVIADLSIVGTAASNIYQAALGAQVSNTTGWTGNVLVINVYMSANSDGIFTSKDVGDMQLINCKIETHYDVVGWEFGFTAGTLTIFNCELNVTTVGVDSPGNTHWGIYAGSTVRVFNTRISVKQAYYENVGIVVDSSSSVVELSNVILDIGAPGAGGVSSSPVSDIDNNVGGTVKTNGVVRLDGNALSIRGPVKDLYRPVNPFTYLLFGA